MSTRGLNQQVTVWTHGLDGYGNYTFGAPTVLLARWEDKQTLFRTEDGDEIQSKAVVYLESDVAHRDYLAEGDQTATADPTTLANAHEVKKFMKTPDLRANDYERKAIL